MSIAWKLAAALLLLSGSFIAGYYTRKPTKVVETKIETKEVEKVITKRIIEKVTQPDGTVKEVVTENVTGVTTSKSKERKEAEALSISNYRLGVAWSLSRDMDYVPDQVQAERRIAGPFWGTAGYSVQHKELLIGVQVEF